ncbi:hypothetical protein PAAG_03906 [Paracoccidioides lutzii Pb01]|uniref:Thioesterase domain-containing protein n=1 Tax=Paracoccidioides lutzii (strain ATCC MYA-826 / Pb01) TaxID=502779 RepID=C1GZG2_PARBA|nr:hypothetical protein PAAG_03906 [Paracoccidioides lutzii Pb01]EEH41985.2 hypothetical protein PAAG_03906 [Paracoccidioides lutzii Pb01]
MSSNPNGTYANFINTVQVPQEDIDFFSCLPCAKPYLHNPDIYRIIPFLPRFDKGEDTTDRFFSNVINSPETIPRMIAVIRRPELNLNPMALAAIKPGDNSEKPLTAAAAATAAATAAAAATTSGQQPSAAAEPDFLLFVQLGPSLSGFRDTVHGGILATLLDETLSNCVEGFRQDMTVVGTHERPRLYTANLQISYRQPVATPGVIIVKAWLKGVEGRKWFLEGHVVGEDGRVRAEAKSLWVMERTGRGKDAAVL